MSKFSENFWSENGFSVIEAYIKKGSKAIEALQTYISERAKIEEEYAKSLQKLLKKTEGVVEIGTVDKIWQKARQEFENEINLRVAFHQELKANATALSNTEKELKKQSKAHLETASKVNKEFQHLSSAITKAQQKYYKACMDCQKVDQEVAAAKSNPKNLAKAQEKQKKAQKEQASAEQEYQAAIQKLTTYQPTYEEKTRTAYDALQETELQRLEAVKSCFEKFHQALKGMSGYPDNMHSSLSQVVNAAKPKQDLHDWIDSNKTGTSPPPPPTFQPFGSGASTSTASSSTSAPSTTSSSSFSKITKSTSTPSVPAAPPPAPPTAAPSTSYSEEYSEEYYGEEYAEEYGEEYAEEYAGEYAEGGYAEGEYAEEYAEEALEVVTAQWAYEAQEENEISFEAGEKITVLSKIDEGWWTGTNSKGETGMFPANYVK